MKIIIKRILTIFLCVVLVCSLALNVVLLISNKHIDNYNKEYNQAFESTNNIVLVNDSYVDRVKAYDTSFNTIANSSNITIISSYMQGTNNYVKETISCSASQDNSHYICKMSGILYDLNNNVIRTSYFPGDGFKYSLENNTKTKTSYSNDDLESYFYNLLNGGIYYLSYLSYDSETIEGLNFTTFMNYGCSLDDLTKEINVTYSTMNFNLHFDKYDTLTKVEMGFNTYLEINYNLFDFQFPSFEGYVE